MSCWALIPIKLPAQGKSRLAGVLGPGERQCLVRAMLDEVLDALLGSEVIEHVAIVTAATDLTRRAVALLPDTGLGLNHSVQQAALSLAHRRARELVVMHGDLPQASAADIDELVLRGRQSGIALAPDRARVGTNAIYLGAGSGFRFQFGAQSFPIHVAEALRCGHVPAIVERPGLAFDVDLPADLARLAGPFRPPPATRRDAADRHLPILHRNPMPWPIAHSESLPT
ncbi:2-phospho-L-lactate guanylyltransferase [Azoarcus sp. DN11]|uniref:2-phospho-L-lactate guanylyltransferase n=1 Tax=Azoarcus sp. DN11 TaxID=356837 RepID=UPI000EB1780D|nr:2-phospho-L-lactate guanylyltransferase [Azoarcus sp. DN11]AYH43680.1 2-phospho-L-lactate guanylyltransferase [Azoarcus sp. DN11]